MAIDFTLEPEIEELRLRVRSFVDEVVKPGEAQIGGLDTGVERDEYIKVLLEMRQKAVDAGNTITVIPEENLAEWQEASQPVIDAWVKTMTDAGHDGQAMLDDARAMLDKARAQ